MLHAIVGLERMLDAMIVTSRHLKALSTTGTNKPVACSGKCEAELDHLWLTRTWVIPYCTVSLRLVKLPKYSPVTVSKNVI